MNGSISLKQFLRMFCRFTQQCEQSEVLQDIADDEIDGSLLSDEIFNDVENNETHLRLNSSGALNSILMSREKSAEIEENNNENSEIEKNNNDDTQNSEMKKDNDNNQYSEIEENNEITNDRIANKSEIEENISAENAIYNEEIYRIPEDDF
ncbi:uncharacterized protein [Anoplolepis gracilipes]|uniref:uncharacterized protein n=1 Tax=Anoplolepis gracilipes TaxID=354296 RepID=UPI003BA19392